jgi:hypothetical protein
LIGGGVCVLSSGRSKFGWAMGDPSGVDDTDEAVEAEMFVRGRETGIAPPPKDARDI